MTETCENKIENLPQFKCVWGRKIDECKSSQLFGANSSLFARHPSANHSAAGEWVVGGIDGQDERSSRKQANFVVMVKDSTYLPSTEDTVFKFELLMPSLLDSWYTNERAVEADQEMSIDIQVAGVPDQSILCLPPGPCLLPVVTGIIKAQMQVPGTQGLEYASFKLQNHTVEATIAVLTETTKVNGALNRLTLTFEISKPLASGSVIVLDFNGLEKIDSWQPGANESCLHGPIADRFTCRNCTLQGIHLGMPALCTSSLILYTSVFSSWLSKNIGISVRDMLAGSYMYTLQTLNMRTRLHIAGSRSWGIWERKATSWTFAMSIKSGASIPAGTHSVSFDVVNPTSMQRQSCGDPDALICPSVVKPAITFHFPLNVGKTSIVYGDCLGAGIPPALEASLVESSQMQGALNVVQFHIVSNVAIPVRGTLIVSGLTVPPISDYGCNVSRTCHASDDALLHCELQPNSLHRGICSCLESTYESSSRRLMVEIRDSANCTGIIPQDRFTFAIIVRNPPRQMQAATISLEAFYPGCADCGPTCACVSTSLPPIVVQSLPIPGPILASDNVMKLHGHMSESNSMPGQANRLAVSVSSNVRLVPGTVFTVVGLRGMLPPTANVDYQDIQGFDVVAAVAEWKAVHAASGNSSTFHIPVSGDDGESLNNIVNSMAWFNMTAGTLTWALHQRLEPGEELFFRVSLINRERPFGNGRSEGTNETASNNGKGETAPELIIAADVVTDACSKNWSFCPVLQDGGGTWNGVRYLLRSPMTGSAQALDSEPMLLEAAVKQSSTVLASLTLLTVRVAANFAVRGNQKTLMVSGLGPVSSESSSTCYLVKYLPDMFPVCSCTPDEGDVCDSCTVERLTNLSSRLHVWIPSLPFAEGADASMAGSCAWNKEEETFTLDLSPGQIIPAEEPFEFGFALLNQQTQRPPAKPNVTIMTSGQSWSRQVANEVLGGADSPKWRTASLTIDSLARGDVAELRIQLEPNVFFVSTKPLGTLITIQGLHSFETESGFVAIHGRDALMISKNAQAYWNKDIGTLEFYGATIVGPTEFSVQLQVAVHETKIPAPVISIQSGQGSIGEWPMRLSLQGAQELRSQQPAVTFAYVEQSSSMLLMRNNISVGLRFNVMLQSTSSVNSTSIIRLSGLTASTSNSTSELALSGADANRFGSSAVWNASTGELLLFLAHGQRIERHSLVSFSFVLSNPNCVDIKVEGEWSCVIDEQLRAGRQVLVSGSFGMYEQHGQIVGKKVDLSAVIAAGHAVLAVDTAPAFDLQRIGQDNDVNGAVNTISLTLSANIALLPGFTLTITPLQSSTNLTNIPLLGASAEALGGSAAYNIGSPSMLVITVAEEIAPTREIVASFRVRNRVCSPACSQLQVTLALRGGQAEPLLHIPPMPVQMLQPILQAGNIIRWSEKAVLQSTSVIGTLNALTFTLQPTAPLFVGTLITISGLRGTQNRSCTPCASGDRIEGLGCSPLCAGTDGGEHVLAVFTDFHARVPHPVFSGKGRWNWQTGVLVIEVATGHVVPSSSQTRFTVVVRNPPLEQLRTECWSRSDELAQECLRVEASVNLCDTDGLPGWNVSDCSPNMMGQSLTYETTQNQTDADAMVDRCGTCVRHADLRAVYDAIRNRQSLVLQPTDVWPPSRQGLPIAVPGTPTSGTYTLQIRVVNWIQQSAMSYMTFSTSYQKPLVYIEGARERSIFSDHELSLSAVGASAWCFPGGSQTEPLKYSWTMTCIKGPCALAPTLTSIADSAVSRFLRIQAGRLPAACTFEFQCQTYQASIDRDATDKVTVNVNVRKLEVQLHGASQDGVVSSSSDTLISVADSWDPENAVTGFHASFGLLATWHVEQVEEQPYCSLADLPIPEVGGVWDNCAPGMREERPDVFHLAPGPIPAILVNGSRIERGKRLKVSVKLQRSLSLLPTPVIDAMSATQLSQTFGGVQEAAIEFDLEPGPHLFLGVKPCNSRQMGSMGACLRQPTSVNGLLLNVWQAEVTGAAGLGLSGTPPSIQYSWDIATPTRTFLIPPQDRDRLRQSQHRHAQTSPQRRQIEKPLGPSHPEGTRTSLRAFTNPLDLILSQPCRGASCALILDRGALVNGQTYVLRLTVTEDGSGRQQHASLLVPTVIPPSSGSLDVAPSLGTALATQFELRADGWATDQDSLPLTYEFYCLNWNLGAESPIRTLIRTQDTDTSIVPLAAGNPADGNTLQLYVRVYNIHGAFARAGFVATVSMPSIDARSGARRSGQLMSQQEVLAMCDVIDAHMDNELAAAVQDKDVQMANHLISSLSAMLSAIHDACSRLTRGKDVTEDCKSSMIRRQGLRFRLLLMLDKANQTQVLTPTALVGQVSALVAISEKSMEMDSNLRLFALRFLRNSIRSFFSVSDTLDAQDMAHAFATVLNNIFASTLAYDDHLHIYVGTRRRDAKVDGRRQSVSTGIQQELPREVAEARAVVSGILSAMSEISSVSTHTHVPGQRPAVISTSSFACTTQRVSRQTFSGIVITDPGGLVSVTVPSDLLDNSMRDSNAKVSNDEQVDLMLTVWSIDANPLPRPQGSSGSIREDFLTAVVSLEVRLTQSTSIDGVQYQAGPIPFQTLASPMRVSIQTMLSVDTSKDPSTGRGLVFAPVLWKWSDWSWSSQNIRLVSATATSASPNSTVTTATAEVRSFEHVSMINRMAGCDSIPGSLAVFDECKVCGGDNSTCSGCDGVPNSGRDRLCSGHGQCGLDTCSCRPFYFGIQCETYCSEVSTCSAHGSCHPRLGTPCVCDKVLHDVCFSNVFT